MKLPRNLNGEEFARHLERRWEYNRVHQTGSNIVLRTSSPSEQTVSVPAHKPLKPGTLNGLIRTVPLHKGISRETLLQGI